MNGSQIDVLCVGAAGYDLSFAVQHHPMADEKLVASELVQCGGGPAANAAVAIARLGYRAAFAGTLGRDFFGDRHVQELSEAGVDTTQVRRVASPTPVSAILVKPDGTRTVIAHGNQAAVLGEGDVALHGLRPRAILFDGHEPAVSPGLARQAASLGIRTILDAGSVHQGTLDLLGLVDYAVCSYKFAATFTGTPHAHAALDLLATQAGNVIITLGSQGAIWRTSVDRGALPAFDVDVVDTTGAGDAFHGAFAAGVVAGLEWPALLRFATAAAALCCTRLGARTGMPTASAIARFMSSPPKPATPPED